MFLCVINHLHLHIGYKNPFLDVKQDFENIDLWWRTANGQPHALQYTGMANVICHLLFIHLLILLFELLLFNQIFLQTAHSEAHLKVMLKLKLELGDVVAS